MKEQKTSKKRFLFTTITIIILIVIMFLTLNIYSKKKQLTPNQAINIIFHSGTGNEIYNKYMSDNFFSSQNIKLSFSNSNENKDINIKGKLNINSNFNNYTKDNVKLYFNIKDQVGDKTILSGEFEKISDKKKRYFYLKNIILTGSSGNNQLYIGQKTLSKLIKKWIFLEKEQDFGLLTKDFDLNKFLLYPFHLSKFLPKHIYLGSGKILYNNKLIYLKKYFPKLFNFINKHILVNKEIYKLSLKDKNLLLLFFGLPPNLSIDDLLKFNAQLILNGENSNIIFSGLSFYKLPYICEGNLYKSKYTIKCINNNINENFNMKINFNTKKISFEYKHPNIKINIDGYYNILFKENEIIFKYNGLISIQNDDLLYHKFVNINTNLEINFHSGKTINIVIPKNSKSLFNVLN